MNTTRYSNWSTSKWLYKIEQVFCPLDYSNHLYTSVTEFLEFLKANMIYFLSSFTEIMGASAKKAKIALSQLILTSNKIYNHLINIIKSKIPIERRSSLKRIYLQILSVIESLLDDCESLNEKLLRNLPLTKYSSFVGKDLFKKNLDILKSRIYGFSINNDLIKLVLAALRNVIDRKEIKRGELKYALMILGEFLDLDDLSTEKMEDILIQYDFNTPKFFNYCAKKCLNETVENTSLHSQMENIISLEERLNIIPQKRFVRLTFEDESIRQQLKTFYKEKKESLKERLELRRNEILDSKLWQDNEKAMLNLSVPQMGLFIRLFMEQGIIPREDIGKTFNYYAKHFRTPHTSSISAESLQKKSSDVEFATAKKMKSQLIGMVNWLNEHYNTSNFKDS
ncbi:hypothetical protein [Sphingobacterium multivorum]|uniref:hypothetical protein n=1 Tax=Sphingobacterium multivorum TaxID=28454 RepID=UPI0028A91796|nr:hypothetical protein [Sphingobacterium multivorum]